MSNDAVNAATAENGSRSLEQRNGRDQDDDGASSRSSGTGLFSLILSSLSRSPATVRESIEAALRSETPDGGSFTDEERGMLLRLLRYGGLRVDDVMVPRADIIAADESEPIGDILRIFVEAGVSRIPLYHETLDDPRGLLHVKDLLSALVAEAEAAKEAQENGGGGPEAATEDAGASLAGEPGRSNGELSPGKRPVLDFSSIDLDRPVSTLKARREVLFVPPSMPAMSLLIRMQSSRGHMALVVDEYGGTDGLVTIEDLVEEIVGDIEDEHDDEDVHISDDPKAGLVASARTPVEDLEEHLGLKLLDADNVDDIDTIGGLVFSLVGRVPTRGEIIPHPSGIEFEILDADPRRIKKVKISRRSAPGDPVAAP